MDQPFDRDVMEDLTDDDLAIADESDLDEFAGFDDDEFDPFDPEDRSDELDEFEASGDDAYLTEDLDDAWQGDRATPAPSADDRETLHTLDAVVADALAAADLSQFLRQLARGVQHIAMPGGQTEPDAPVATRRSPQRRRSASGRSLGHATVSPPARSGESPTPATRSIAAMARTLGVLLSSPSRDATAVLNRVIEWAAQRDGTMATPIIAGLALYLHLPPMARLSRSARFRLVHSTSRAIRTLTQQQGGAAARAIAPILQSVQKIARREQWASQEVAIAIRRTAHQVAANPRKLKRLMQTARAMAPGDAPVNPATAPPIPPVPPSQASPDSGPIVHRLMINGQELIVNGPVEIIIRSLG